MEDVKVPERELTLPLARQRALSELRALGLDFKARTLGQGPCCVQVALSAPGLPECAHGAGKGLQASAETGGLFEALEHYLSAELGRCALHYRDIAYFTHNPVFFDESVLHLLTEQPALNIACRNYIQPFAHSSFSYPLALCSPDYCETPTPRDDTDYRALRRYTSNSGTAIGASYNEAVLHATHECIERDAVSLFFLSHFYYQSRAPLHRVDLAHSDPRLHALWRTLETQMGVDVVLLDISNEFLAKTYLAFALLADPLPSIYGSGTSLDGAHAAWRALTELAQVHLSAGEPELRAHLLGAQQNLTRFPRLLRCLQFDPHWLMRQGNQIPALIPSPAPAANLTKQIQRVVRDLEQHGRSLGVSTLYASERGTCVVNVVIPGLERFHIIASGNIVVPQARGRRLQSAGVGDE